VYGTFIHSILYTQDFLACWQNSHHNIEKKKEVGHLGRHHNIRYDIDIRNCQEFQWE
jgi:hypothetical protein